MSEPKHLTLFTPNAKGQLIRQYDARCGVCSNWHDLIDSYTQREAEKSLRARGWVKYARLGWVCADCLKDPRR